MLNPDLIMWLVPEWKSAVLVIILLWKSTWVMFLKSNLLINTHWVFWSLGYLIYAAWVKMFSNTVSGAGPLLCAAASDKSRLLEWLQARSDQSGRFFRLGAVGQIIFLSKSLLCGLRHVVAAVNKDKINPRASLARVFRPDAAEAVFVVPSSGGRRDASQWLGLGGELMPLVEGPSNYPKQSKMSRQSLAAPAATGQQQKKKTFAFIQIGSLIDSKRPDWPLGGEIFLHPRCRGPRLCLPCFWILNNKSSQVKAFIAIVWPTMYTTKLGAKRKFK